MDLFSEYIDEARLARYNPAMFPGSKLRKILLLSTTFVALAADAPDSIRLTVLSSRPEMVSGGDALVRVDPPRENLQVRLNGTDVTTLFQPAKDGLGMVALLSGLRPGSNELTAAVADVRASLHIFNYPITGPIISGPMSSRSSVKPSASSCHPVKPSGPRPIRLAPSRRLSNTTTAR